MNTPLGVHAWDIVVTRNSVWLAKMKKMRVRVFETDDANAEPAESLGPVHEVHLGEQGSSPEQIVESVLQSLQLPGFRLFAFNSLDQELSGWEEVTEANAANLSTFLTHRRQLKAVRGMKAPTGTVNVLLFACVAMCGSSRSLSGIGAPFRHCCAHTTAGAPHYC